MFAGSRTKLAFGIFFALLAVAAIPATPCRAQAVPGPATKSVGVVKVINGNTITLTPDNGPEISVVAQDSTRVVRIPPGETNLKNATPIQLQDLQPGDRILVYSRPSDDAKTLNASTVVVMKQSDVVAKQAQDREDWQKRGMNGLVSVVDASAGTVTISQPSLNGRKSITLHIAKTTVLRRYAPDSVKFEDAKPGMIADIKTGDQVRVLGTASADGNDVSAEVIVSGTFRNLAGTVVSTDATANTVTILDLTSKKPVLVKIAAESQLHKLPAMMAQRMAMRLKGGANGAASGAGAQPPVSGTGGPSSAPAQPPAAGMPERAHGNGPPDLQQIIARTPAVAVADLQKGDAVMILSTEGTPTGGVTAITLVAGVEPLLQSKGSQAMTLSPWSIGGGGGGDGESQ